LLRVPIDDAGAVDESFYGVERVATNGSLFVVENRVAASETARIFDAATLNFRGAPCAVHNPDAPVAYVRDTLAWVEQPASGQYQLLSASVSDGTCTPRGSVRFGAGPNASRVVGLVSERYALAVKAWTYPTVRLALFDLAMGLEVGASDPLPENSGYLDSLVMGDAHSAVLVTRDRPIFVAF
jgi:hypothetical protein